jgi:hypothetical protein
MPLGAEMHHLHELRELGELRAAPRSTPPAVLWTMFIAAAAGIVVLVAGEPGSAPAAAPLPGATASPSSAEHRRSAAVDVAGHRPAAAKSS